MAEFPSNPYSVSNNTTLTSWENDTNTLERHLWIYSAPVILLFSIGGNVMTILIMTQKCMRKSSTCVYLTVMAVADMSVVIVGIIPEWLDQMDITCVWEIGPYVCKVELWLYYTLLDFAIWVLVAFTCDRVIAVCFPFHKRQFCTKKRAFVACGIVFALSNLNLHVFWTRGRVYSSTDNLIYKNCGDLEPYVYFETRVRPWVVLALASLVPFCIILAGNIAIVCELLRSRTMSEKKSLKSTTVMCLSISFAFLILVTPNIVLLIGKDKLNKPGNMAYRGARAIASQLVYINHSVNFLLYALTGSRFREELILRWRVSILRLPQESSNISSSRLRNTLAVPGSPVSMVSMKGRYLWQQSVDSPNGAMRLNHL